MNNEWETNWVFTANDDTHPHKQYVCVHLFMNFSWINTNSGAFESAPSKIHTNSQTDTIEMLEHFSHHANDIYVYTLQPTLIHLTFSHLMKIWSTTLAPRIYIYVLWCEFHVNIYFRHRNFRISIQPKQSNGLKTNTHTHDVCGNYCIFCASLASLFKIYK